ncbi:MAG: AAA family ATPase, partial [Nitrosopumilus sp.]
MSTPEEVEFKDFNIVFGDNGSGKSRIVRAIKTFVENRKIEKHYFYPDKPSVISFEIDGVVYKLDDSQKYTPNEVPDLEKNLAVFDLDFITNNLKIEPDEQGNKLIVIAGFNLCSDLINTFEKVIDEIINLRFSGYSTGFTKALTELKSDLPTDNYISTQLSNITFDFTKKESWNAKKHIKTLDSIQSSVSALTVLTKDELEKLKEEKEGLDTQITNFETDKSHLEEFLAFTYNYKKQSLNTEKITKSVIAFKTAISKLSELDQYSENQIEFIKLGLKLLSTSPNCPFCIQDITKQHTQDKIKNYKNLVKSLTIDTKQEFIDELEEYIEALNNIPSSDDINFKDYITQFKLIKKLVKDKRFSIWASKNISTKNIESLKSHLIDIKSNVEQNKVKSVKEINKRLLNKFSSELSILNSTISANKTKFDTNKLITQKIFDDDYKAGIDKLINKRGVIASKIKKQEDTQKLKAKDEIITLLKINLKEIKKIDNLIGATKTLNTNFTNALVKEMNSFGKDYGNLLQKFYMHFYPNGVFNYIDWSSKVTRPAGTFKYKVGISAKNTARKNKDGKKPDSVLSEGNYNALALAYFFALNEKLNPSIIIFDDPITGMDSGKRLQLVRL